MNQELSKTIETRIKRGTPIIELVYHPQYENIHMSFYNYIQTLANFTDKRCYKLNLKDAFVRTQALYQLNDLFNQLIHDISLRHESVIVIGNWMTLLFFSQEYSKENFIDISHELEVQLKRFHKAMVNKGKTLVLTESIHNVAKLTNMLSQNRYLQYMKRFHFFFD